MSHLVQLTSSCNQPNCFNQANVSKMTIILDMSKFMKRTSSLTCLKMTILIIIFNLLKFSKITILRISISPVMEGLQTSNLSSMYTYLCSLEMVSTHMFRDTSYWLLPCRWWSVAADSLSQANIEKYLLSFMKFSCNFNFQPSFFAHLIFVQTKKSAFHAQLIFAHF